MNIVKKIAGKVGRTLFGAASSPMSIVWKQFWVLRLKVLARMQGGFIDIRVGSGCRLGWVSLYVEPTTRSTLVLGDRVGIESGVTLSLHGGSIEIGNQSRIRKGVVLNVAGSLILRGQNLLSWNSIVHANRSVIFESMAGTGEVVTVVDSSHFHGERGSDNEYWYDNSQQSDVVIGSNTWLAAKSTVTAGAIIGERTTVAAHAVVRSGDYPADSFLAGVPAVAK